MQNSPFGLEGRFYRGNLHTHSNRSDGRLPPEAVVEHYRTAGYDFLALTDHFMAKYDFPVTDTSALRSADFTTLISAELHAPQTLLGETWHLKAVGLPLDFAALQPGETGPEVARRAAAAGAFVGIVHPSWYGLTLDDARTIEVAHAIEIYNHGSALEVDRGYDWPFCDALLNEGWHLTGYATDDAHLWNDDAFGGWVQVQAQELTPQALLDSLKSGRFYSSQGPEIHDVLVDEDEVHVYSSPAAVVSATGRGSRATFVRGQRLEHVCLPLAPFDEGYFRITVSDAEGKKAWTNPFWRS